ncbi:GntR family transcriptional regulator [Pelagibius sp. Alg239-R121]|uniref:GntR family transcriptional regulator n=1 Tax=Pelagibius sp. Alg239-R121 TaxID=2993448 RepID=UPI0024A72AE3|nr:GntR family transcriptional regulator [Pelagibius sp. Alg239-R121]
MIQQIRQKPDLVDEVYEALKSAILMGDLAESEAMVQDDLVEKLGVSRQPVSHALALLKHEGLVIERGRRGLMVAPIDADRIRALYQVRGAIDGLAAGLAAGRAIFGGLKVEEREPLEQALVIGEAAVKANDIKKLVDADVNFHQAVYGLSGNPAIAEMVQPSWPHFQRSMRVVLDDPDYRARAWVEHNEIAEAIMSSQGRHAEELARQHATDAGEATWIRLSQRTAAA